MAVLYPMYATRKGGVDIIFVWTITGYYGFFCLFMLALFFRIPQITEYCGFLNSIFMKSFFYVFLASLAFADYRLWPNYSIGAVFAGMSVLTWVRYCGKEEVVAKK